MRDPLRHLYELASRQDGVISIVDARTAGLTRGEIERRVTEFWIKLYEGVYLMRGAPLTWRGRVRAACLAGAPHAAVSHRSAAAFYDVPGGNRNLVEVTCRRWLRAQHSGLIVHERSRVLPSDTQQIDGIPVTRPELVAFQLASIYRSPDFIERVLHAMRRKRLITFESTEAMFKRHARRGVRGVRVMRTALLRWDPSTTTAVSRCSVRAGPSSPPASVMCVRAVTGS